MEGSQFAAAMRVGAGSTMTACLSGTVTVVIVCTYFRSDRVRFRLDGCVLATMPGAIFQTDPNVLRAALRAGRHNAVFSIAMLSGCAQGRQSAADGSADFCCGMFVARLGGDVIASAFS